MKIPESFAALGRVVATTVGFVDFNRVSEIFGTAFGIKAEKS